MKHKKGFTLIELLVVIAIIGILSSIVLASLNSARGKGANAAVKADMHGIRNQADIFYDGNTTSYAGMCADPTVVNIGANADSSGGGTFVCNDAATAWAASTALKIPDADGSTYWCVDSLGSAKGATSALGSATVCP